MPILWRYILSGYCKVFILSVCAFISVLLVSRFKDIARFAALSSDWPKTGLYTLYQISHILPIAMPISALIASLLLFQKMSRTFELTALRASGCSLASLLAPSIFASLFFSLANFTICTELSPFCRREAQALFFQATSANPLLLLQRQHLGKLKQTYVDVTLEDGGKTARDLFFITYNGSHARLNLVSAAQLHMDGDTLHGSNISILSHLHSEKAEAFDPLILENQASMSTAAPLLAAALKKQHPKLEANTLNFRMLQLHKKNIAIVELLRRIDLALAVFSLTFLGSVFGMQPGRAPAKTQLVAALFFTLVLLIGYCLGQKLKAHPLYAALAFLLPHPLLWCSCILQQIRIGKGTW